MYVYSDVITKFSRIDRSSNFYSNGCSAEACAEPSASNIWRHLNSYITEVSKQRLKCKLLYALHEGLRKKWLLEIYGSKPFNLLAYVSCV